MANLPAVVNKPPTSLIIKRPPATDDELWQMVATLWGVEIPRTKVCPNHCAPFDAFADAYFARSALSIWKASRGFGGKSYTLALLGITEAVLLKAQVNVLGGSSSQSLNVHEHMQEAWDWVLSPKQLVSNQTRFQTALMHGGRVRALMASQKSVRGPHPQRLRLDEIDEMEWEILEASLGQPMSTKYVTAHTVMSSTHQYPDGTMSKMLKRAESSGFPVFEWCWRETSEPHGWLPIDDIARKRKEVSQAMWEIEYDLQEPSFEGRAIDTAAVDFYFDVKEGTCDGREGHEFIFHKPEKGAKYITGADWAKKHDWTVIRTFRVDCEPWVEVAFERVGRMPWPIMVAKLNKRAKMYKGQVYHDATGIGDVVGDYLEVPANDIIMVGRTRADLFSDYVAAIEGFHLKSPRIEYAWTEHKYATHDDLYGRGHPPDTMVAGALAWAGRTNKAPTVPPLSISKESYWGGMNL